MRLPLVSAAPWVDVLDARVSLTADAGVSAAETAWVAFVSCDANATDASQTDIFARAKELGATTGVRRPSGTIPDARFLTHCKFSCCTRRVLRRAP